MPSLRRSIIKVNRTISKTIPPWFASPKLKRNECQSKLLEMATSVMANRSLIEVGSPALIINSLN